MLQYKKRKKIINDLFHLNQFLNYINHNILLLHFFIINTYFILVNIITFVVVVNFLAMNFQLNFNLHYNLTYK